ncbi:unknown [Feldmannia species virus]|uniref:Uncharacterized protein n=1 Tax=Feldmannia species virus TaxID=39420 RepID=B5LWM4_9PHYC|nr:hypothetical protein FeldSpV_gp135 [Feldmannia species virus]ACH46887.1 unknown [Feldmannia species virus]
MRNFRRKKNVWNSQRSFAMDLIESMDGSTIRVDKNTKLGSVIDTIRMVLECDSSNANTSLGRLVLSHPGLGEKYTQLKVNGRGKPTPVADAKTLIEIVWLLPGRRAHAFRCQRVGKICRLLGGDTSLVSEIEARHATLTGTEEGRATQEFFLNDNHVTIDQPDQVKELRSGEEPSWFKNATAEEKRAFASTMVNKAIVSEEVEMYDFCKAKLESVGQFTTRDMIEFGDRVRDAQRRALRAGNMMTSTPVDDTVVISAVARPVDDTIDSATGLPLATPECSESVRGVETSICNEAAKLGICVGEKGGEIGKELIRRYTKRYGVEAGLNIPKRPTTYRGKPFNENCYWSRDADLVQEAIRIVCSPEKKSTLLKWVTRYRS